MHGKNIEDLLKRAQETAEMLVQKLKAHCVTIALAESCTAGLVSALMAGISGASKVLWGSFVCYTQEAKVSMLDLDNGNLSADGSVSRETAVSMARGAKKISGADIAAAVTGLAGPLGDGSNVPVGTVWVAVAGQANNEEVLTKVFHFTGKPEADAASSRNEIRLQAAIEVMEMVLTYLTKK